MQETWLWLCHYTCDDDDDDDDDDEDDMSIFIVHASINWMQDTSKNTKATFKCCYALPSYVGTIFSHDKLLA